MGKNSSANAGDIRDVDSVSGLGRSLEGERDTSRKITLLHGSPTA